jgi:energy-coupling factor transporter ATP-binding protein EcfA2
MKIKAIKIKGFRSIESAKIIDCGNLNVFIGKNNAGKSNILSAIELIHGHLAKSVIAGRWSPVRPVEEFYNRDVNAGVRIAVEFMLSENVNAELRSILQASYANLERATATLEVFDSIVFVLSGVRSRQKSYLYTEQIVLGSLVDADEIRIEGTSLLEVSKDMANELFEIQELISVLNSDIEGIDKLSSSRRDFSYLFSESYRVANRSSPSGIFSGNPDYDSLSIPVRRDVQNIYSNSKSAEEFSKALVGLSSGIREKVDDTLKRETSKPFATFAGDTRAQPSYVGFIMNYYGSIPLLHLRETKAQIGRNEATELLKLKITRGGPDRLKAVQNTVRSLLGVEVDAFQSDGQVVRGLGAEMDVDKFLAEANGAGVREALRLILDLELKQPALVLIEEPEVHLHPGLEYAMYSYLREKSKSQQIFVTTHSTNFVDSVSFQNIYLVARENERTTINVVDKEDGALEIPTSLGLRLSTVFMYDRLLFVEGPSDEAVLREFARILDIDLAGANMNFVQMGGVTNFAHYAAESTLSLLSRKNLKLWFLTDRDERSDGDVQAMMQKLGENARLLVTESRDLESYLLNPKSVQHFIASKLENLGGDLPSVEEVRVELNNAAISLKEEVIARRINSKLLKPIYLQTRAVRGTLEDKLHNGIVELQNRLDSVATVSESIKNATSENWEVNAMKLTPGADILDKCCKYFGVRFQKEAGDSTRLASCIERSEVPREIANFLKEVTAL